MDRKARYLEEHQDEREYLLGQDRQLRDRYFQLHNDQAADFYGRHSEFGGEWREL